MQNFRALGAPPPDLQNSPPLRISGYAPAGFKAKAKDFKMCPRGQGRPRGLHLWSTGTLDHWKFLGRCGFLQSRSSYLR